MFKRLSYARIFVVLFGLIWILAGCGAYPSLLSPEIIRATQAQNQAADGIQYASVGFVWVLAALLIYVTPGLGLLALFLPEFRFTSWPTRLTLALGVSLALYPLILAWLQPLGLQLGIGNVGIGLLIGGVGLLWRFWRDQSLVSAPPDLQTSQATTASDLLPGITLFLVTGLVVGVRLWIVRTLDVPMWGDSIQHAAITQLLLDHGGLFHSWEPYAAFNSLTVHFGFSANVAALAWVTGLDGIRGTVIGGQFINAMAVLALYPLVEKLLSDVPGRFGKQWGSVIAVVVAGLLFPMPAFYVNWGRYAQLAGQAVLPAAIWLFWRVAERDGEGLGGKRFEARPAILAGLILAGATLNYYRMPIYYVAFGIVWLLFHALPKWRLDRVRWTWGVLRVGAIAVSAMVMLAPWVVNVMGSNLASALGASAGAATSPAMTTIMADYRAYSQLSIYVPIWAQWVSGIAFLLALILGQRRVLMVGIWTALLAAVFFLSLVGMPAANFMNSFAVMISLYIPVALGVGWLGGVIIERLFASLPAQGVVSGFVVFMILAVSLWGVPNQLDILSPSFQMVFPADQDAMQWIRQNTAPSDRFLVEGFRIYGGTSAVGADAGWWIPLLTKRPNTMPPQYALLNERPIQPDYPQAVVDLVADLENTSLADAQGTQLLCANGITYIYIGQGTGMVGADVSQLYTADELQSNPDLELVFFEDAVRIFSVKAGTCD